MSKTFTSRPAVTRGRGRGRGNQATNTMNARPLGSEAQGAARGRGQPTQRGGAAGVGRAAQPANRGRGGVLGPGQDRTQGAEPSVEGNQEELGQRMSYQGGYTMITPNEKKRQQISQMAQKETHAYNAHRQQNTPASFSYVGTTGGGEMTLGAARQRQVQTSPTKPQRLAAQHERKSFMKQKEEEDLQKKREEQRKKALQNEERKKAESQNDARKWDQQKRVTNEAFLRRLEAKSQPGPRSETKPAPKPISETNPAPKPTPQERLRAEQTPKATTSSVPAHVGGATGGDCDNAAGEISTVDGLSSEQQQRLAALSAIFPQYVQNELVTILEHVGFSLDAAISLLQD